MECENSYYIKPILCPGCARHKAMFRVKISYDEYGIETDTLRLCPECKDHISKDARKHGYSVKCSSYN